MATPKIIADFETQLATALSAGDTSFTLASATDDDGVSLPTGKYYFTIDNGTSQKEYVVGTLTDTSVASVSNVTRQGTESSGVDRSHRVGASVIMTDFLTYKNYIDETTTAGAADADTNTKGVVEGATLAEVRARTATGSTGAALVITPDVADDLPTEDEKAAMAGGGDLGAPSTSNKYVTQTGLGPALSDLYDAQTFPVVESSATNSGDSVSPTIGTLSGLVAGDLILVFMYTENSVLSIEPSGYTKIGEGTYQRVYAKIATGSDTFSPTMNTIRPWTTIAYRISNYWNGGSVENIVKVSSAGSGLTYSSPQTLNPDNTYGYYTWFAAKGNQATGVTYSAAPSGYGNFEVVTSGSDIASAVARKELRAVAEDPADFTATGAETNRDSTTVSVRAAESNYNT